MLGERPEINICFASDGAAPQWTALEAMRSRLPVSTTGHRMALVEAFHVAEYVQLAANAVEGERTSGAKILAATWRETIKEEINGVPRVLRAMRSRRAKASTKTARKDLKRAIDYITNQHKLGRMNYPEALARNFPIGTGVTEAAAKTVVGTRMKRAGARFSQHRRSDCHALPDGRSLGTLRPPSPGTPCNPHGFDRRLIMPPLDMHPGALGNVHSRNSLKTRLAQLFWRQNNFREVRVTTSPRPGQKVCTLPTRGPTSPVDPFAAHLPGVV